MFAESNNDITLWKINVMQCSADLTLLKRHNQLKENPPPPKKEAKMVRIPTAKS